MTRLVLFLAGTAGLVVVGRAASFYAGVDSFAFGLTLGMAGVFVVGMSELVLRARRTAAARVALERVVHPPEGERADLEAAPPALRARLRAHLERDPMPADVPVIAPFLVGLLVMLGLLGTFLGLFETLRGARTALEASADVDSLRAGLASPMGGLMRSFGTSAAGVASSAMLGLAMVFVRRAGGQLQEAIHAACAGPLAHRSASRRQLSALEELAEQGRALPAAADALREAVQLLERIGEGERARGEQAAERLDGLREAWREAHHASVGELRAALQDAAERAAGAAGAALAPATTEVVGAVQGAAREQLAAIERAANEQLAAMQSATRDQLESIERSASERLGAVQTAMRDQLEVIGSAQAEHVGALQKALEAERASRRAEDAALAERLQSAVSAVAGELEAAGRDRRADESALADRFTQHLEALGAAEASLGERFTAQLQTLAESEARHVAAIGERLEDLSERLASQLGELVTAEDGRAKAVGDRLEALVGSWREALEASQSTALEHGQQVAGALRAAEIEIRRGAETVVALTTDAANREAVRDARAEAVLERLNAMGDALATARNAHTEALAEVEDRLAERQENRAAKMAGALQAQAEKLAGLQDALESQQLARVQAVADALASQAERLGGIQEALEARHAAHAAELSGALVAEAKRLGAGLEETSALVREAAGATAAGGAELAAAAELFTAAVERHGEAAERWLEGLGHIEKAVEEAGEGAAVDVLGQYLARTHELFDQQLGFQQALVAQIENQGPLFGASVVANGVVGNGVVANGAGANGEAAEVRSDA